jgi:hypothetical protein
MHKESKEIVEQIRAHGLAIGTLANEAIESANDGRYMAALSCLFILAEQSVKQASQVTSGNFKKEISTLENNNLLSADEILILTELRKVRNAIFHESHYMYAIVSEGKATMFSEQDAQEQLWDKFSLLAFTICLKLITQSSPPPASPLSST